MRRTRTLRTLFVASLLLLMQQAALRHALDHVGQWLDRPHEQTLLAAKPDVPCAICALFAGGSAALTNDAVAVLPPAPALPAPDLAPSSPTAAAPSSYLARAPPALL